MNFTMYTQFSDTVLKRGIEYATEYAARLGFNSVEVFANANEPERNAIPDTVSAKYAKSLLDKAGLSVACYSVFVNLFQNEEGEKELMKHVEIAAQLGSPYLHHTLLPWLVLPENAPEYENAIDTIVEAAGRVADYASKFGITCIYEDQGYYVNGIEGFGGFWKKMKSRSQNVGICGDLGNILFVNEKPEAFLQAYIDDICHVHVKDYLWKKGLVSPGRFWLGAKGNTWLRDTMVGSGIIDFEACIQILNEAGYRGSYALELGHPEPFEEGVYQAMEYLRLMHTSTGGN